MTPAGPERDREIALIREDRVCHDFDVLGYCTHCNVKETSNSIRDSLCEKTIKPYSTDISAAMELWEEMFKGNVQRGMALFQDLYAGWSCFIGTNAIKVDYCGAKTAADAISGAYVKWRTA